MPPGQPLLAQADLLRPRREGAPVDGGRRARGRGCEHRRRRRGAARRGRSAWSPVLTRASLHPGNGFDTPGMSEAGPRRLPTRRSVPGFTPGPPLVIVTSYDSDGIAPALRVRGLRRQACPLRPAAPAFVGKVTLSMLLHRYGEVLGRVYVLVRRGSAASAERRFFDKVAPSEPFQPLRDHHGDAEARWRSSATSAACSTATSPTRWLGLADAERRRRSTGQVRRRRQLRGPGLLQPVAGGGPQRQHLRRAERRRARAALGVPLVHMSTAFVAGNRSGLVFEDEEVRRLLPPQGRAGRARLLPGAGAGRTREKLVARLREQADDKALTSDLPPEGAGAAGGGGPRRRATRRRCASPWAASASCGCRRAGPRRAWSAPQHWGWPNTYTYTKSPGRAGHRRHAGPALRHRAAVHRGERAALPVPRVERGLHHLGAAGLRAASRASAASPPATSAILDIIPVDLVAGSLIAITAHALQAHAERRVYHQASGDSNPFYATPLGGAGGPLPPPLLPQPGDGQRARQRRALAASSRSRSASRQFQPAPRRSSLKGARLLKQAHRRGAARAGARRASRRCWSKAREQLDEVEEQAASPHHAHRAVPPLPLGEPLRLPLRQHPLALRGAWPRRTAAKIPWDPARASTGGSTSSSVHLPGLEKWVFPGLEEEREKRKAIHAHRDLLELFDAAVHALPPPGRLPHGWRASSEERFTYGEVHRYAARVGSFLLRSGREARRPGAAGLREPPRVGHRLLRHPARRRHRGAGGPRPQRGRGGQHRPPQPRRRRCLALRGGRRRTSPGLCARARRAVARGTLAHASPRRWRATRRTRTASGRCGRARRRTTWPRSSSPPAPPARPRA